ncbi:hypothetical protein [Lacrimispora algidixylanolytica]|uniref:Uncharacterized protein n=1 Tax=Lacrimispora algidixylanolytica TaxID=94868 RepID=A0A419TBT0_9FIRM|nr:hypothetical protein [Lacrimispora algidixylanolytica]RKD34923.1 hypothetical protein BET01_00780 [Lacrimispora algidixylanolytica]
MIVINTPLRADIFQKAAEEEGLIFVKKTGMKLIFENPQGEDAKKAEVLKKKWKGNKDLAAIYFQVLPQ